MPAVPLMTVMSPTGERCCPSSCCVLLALLHEGTTQLLPLCIRAFL